MTAPPTPCIAILGLDLSEPAVAAALVAAIAGLLGKALAFLVAGPRDRRRALYGAAYRDAMAWTEMLYRVRRRANTEEAERALIERFHELQEQIDLQRGWLGSESVYLARSYCRVVEAIKGSTLPLIQRAWEIPGRKPAEIDAGGEEHPDCEAASLRFLFDIRLHLSIIPFFPWLLLAWRNRNWLRRN